MSQISVDSVIPQSGTTITVGASGDTVNLGSGVSTNGFLPSAISVSGTDFQFDSGYGSTATAYGCRAWVNFNGTGTVAIRESKNVSSITDNAIGDYTVNFTTAMPDVNYAGVVSASNESSSYPITRIHDDVTVLSTSCRLLAQRNTSGVNIDTPYVSFVIFR